MLVMLVFAINAINANNASLGREKGHFLKMILARM